MAKLLLAICSLLFCVVLNSALSSVERGSLINAAIQEAQNHAAAQDDNYLSASSRQRTAGRRLFAFKLPSREAVKQGSARLLLEDMVRRAERSLMEKERQAVQASNAETRAEVLAKELLHTPGSLLTNNEIAKMFQESGCPNFLLTPPDCSDAEVMRHRTPNGVCNNLENPLLGSAPARFRRLVPPQYEDGISQLRGTMQSEETAILMGPFAPPNPSARLVSQTVVRDRPEEETSFSHILMQWGQWIDHDLDETPAFGGCPTGCDIETDRCVPIPVAEDDQVFGGAEPVCHPFPRSIPACGEDSSTLVPREQVNELTSFIDASQVYGSNAAHLDAVRVGIDSPFLRVGENIPAGGKPSLPRVRQSDIDERFVGCPGGVESGCFLAGDIRVNEQISLTVMHTIWLREHNRIAAELQTINPQWSPDKVFKVTREIVAAEIQKITYKDFLAIILGQDVFDDLIGPYKNYDPRVDPTVPNGFAAAAYRYGHSQIQPMFDRLNEAYNPISAGPLNLVDAFFDPSQFEASEGTDPLLRGLLTTEARRVNEFLNDVLTTRLFESGSSRLDLASLNIQRGRDHGLPPYPTWKRWAARGDICDISSDIANQLTFIRLLQTYGSLETVDLWVGGLAEERLPGSLLGATFACIFARTFGPIRDGDRFYYENVDSSTGAFFTEAQRDEIEKTSLSRVICDNADNIQEIQPNAFRTDQTREPCTSLSSVDLNAWRETQGGGCALRIRVRVNRDLYIKGYSRLVRVGSDSMVNDVVVPADDKTTCLPFTCPEDGVDVRLQVSTPGFRNLACRVKVLSNVLPPNTRYFPKNIYRAVLSTGNIGSTTGAYPDLASCESGTVIALGYTCLFAQSEEDLVHTLEQAVSQKNHDSQAPETEKQKVIGLLEEYLHQLEDDDSPSRGRGEADTSPDIPDNAHLFSELEDALDELQ